MHSLKRGLTRISRHGFAVSCLLYGPSGSTDTVSGQYVVQHDETVCLYGIMKHLPVAFEKVSLVGLYPPVVADPERFVFP